MESLLNLIKKLSKFSTEFLGFIGLIKETLSKLFLLLVDLGKGLELQLREKRINMGMQTLIIGANVHGFMQC